MRQHSAHLENSPVMQNGTQLSGLLGAAFSPIAADQYNQIFNFLRRATARVRSRETRRVHNITVWCISTGRCPPLADARSAQTNLGFIAALVIGTLAILGGFIDIPFISEYAFWVLAGAYFLLVGVGTRRR
jgi:hypothetical protein